MRTGTMLAPDSTRTARVRNCGINATRMTSQKETRTSSKAKPQQEMTKGMRGRALLQTVQGRGASRSHQGHTARPASEPDPRAGSGALLELARALPALQPSLQCSSGSHQPREMPAWGLSRCRWHTVNDKEQNLDTETCVRD